MSMLKETAESKMTSRLEADDHCHINSRAITTTFHIVTEAIELDLQYIKELGTANYICVEKIFEVTLYGQNVRDFFDDVLIMETEDDYSKFDDFFAKHLTDPLKTRVVYSGDCDIVEAAKRRQMYGIPGATVEESIICLDKTVFKRCLQKANVKHAACVEVRQVKEAEIEDIVKDVESKLNYPLFGKPTNLNSARCTAEIHNQKALKDYLAYAMKFPDLEFMIETFLAGKQCHIEAVIHQGRQDRLRFDHVLSQPHLHGILRKADRRIILAL